MRTTVWAFFALMLLAALAEQQARACTVCANPSIEVRDGNTNGHRKLRLDLRVQVGGARAGTTRATDVRTELVYALAPIPRLELSLVVPALYRSLQTGRATKIDGVPGDLELAATGTLWSTRTTGFAEALTLTGGVKLPTAPAEHDAYGTLLSSILQPGCNAVTPNLSVAYAFTSGRWGFSAGGGLFFPISVRDAPHAGESLRSAPTSAIPTRAVSSDRS